MYSDLVCTLTPTQPIQRTLRELPSYTIIQAPSSPLESSGSEGQSSIDGSLKTRTVSESSNGNPSTTPSSEYIISTC